MVRDGLVFKDEDGQVIFNQYSFCELVKHLLVELVGISYEEASQTVERSPLAAPVSNVMGVAVFSHDLPYYWAISYTLELQISYRICTQVPQEGILPRKESGNRKNTAAVM